MNSNLNMQGISEAYLNEGFFMPTSANTATARLKLLEEDIIIDKNRYFPKTVNEFSITPMMGGIIDS